MELLEREPYLARLDAALAEAGAGSGRIALVSGEAGIGKSSLVERFTRSHQHSVRVLWGTCDSLFTPRPFGPLHDMAGQIHGDMPALLESDSNRNTIFSTFLSELQKRTAIVVFEDLHWADEATLDLLRFVSRRITNTSSLLVMTYRDDEFSPRHPLRAVLGDLASSSATIRILLPPLTEQAVQTLIGERGMDASALHRQTGGNPFFVTEVLSSPTSGISPGIPPTIRDAVLARAARLTLSARAVLEAAAVIGTRVEPWLLEEVTGAEAYAAEECMAAGMLLAQGDELAFRHELARQTVLETISPPRKRVLHRLVLDSLKSSPARNDLARLAHHAEAAGDREAVLEYAPAAARQAAVARTHRAAAALYALALRFAEDLLPEERAQMLDEYSVECDVIDQRPEAIAVRRTAAELWKQTGNMLKYGESLGHQALLLDLIGEKTEAEQVNRSAIEVLEGLPSNRELVIVYNTQALLCLSNLENYKGITLAEKAIALAEQLEDTPRFPRLYETLGLCWLHLDYVRGCAYLERSLSYARDLGQVIRTANTTANIGSVYVEFHQFQNAEHFLSDGINYTLEHDMDSVRVYMQGWQAILYVHLGRWDEASDIAGQVLQRPGTSPGRGPALVALGRLRARRGYPGADTALDESLAILIKLGYRQREGMIRAARAESAWLAGDRERTLDEARAVYELAMNMKHPWYAGELAYWRWRAGEDVPISEWMAKPFTLHIAGDWRAAAQEWERLGCPYEQARALADGDTNAQVTALEIFERLGARPAAEELRQKLKAAGARYIPRQPRSSTRENPFSLTGRQVEILALLIKRLSNAEIAARLHISPKTVDHHVSEVLAKLDVHSREAAAELARQNPHFKK